MGESGGGLLGGANAPGRPAVGAEPHIRALARRKVGSGAQALARVPGGGLS